MRSGGEKTSAGTAIAGAILAFVLTLTIGAASAARLDADAINQAQLQPNQRVPERGFSPLLVKAQVLLDRAHFSPGEIDGKAGDNFHKALSAFAQANGLPDAQTLNADLWQRLTQTSDAPAVVSYTLTAASVSGPFTPKIPTHLEKMKALPHLGYRDPREEIAETFHVSEALLTALNPGRHFAAGEVILVPNLGPPQLPAKTARIEIDKTAQTARAFDQNGALLAFYPVTAGSTEKPAPSGRVKITGIAHNPTYHYNPAYAFRGVHARRPFTIKPGPNNPVGVVWIGLQGEGYGIHGTPDPSQVGKTQSHGCVRLTNWDALQLASSVSKGTVVDFVGDEQMAQQSRAQARKRTRR
ncbi:MAG TPA: L,D-transpeptidase [Pseudolabrys sp.]|nr:L,D-transpeptidase [Pseudolabrys sp.]